MVSRVDTAPHGVKTPTLGSWSQRHMVGKVPSPDHELFHTSTNPISRGRKRWSPESIVPRTIWKPQFGGPATPGEDKVQSTDHKSVHTSTTPTYSGRTWLSSGSIPPRAVWKPHSKVRNASTQRLQGGILSHLLIRNPSIHLLLQQTGVGNDGPPGRYRTARCGNPSPTG